MKAIKFVFISIILFSVMQTFSVVVAFDNLTHVDPIDIEIYLKHPKSPITIRVGNGEQQFLKIDDTLFDAKEGVSARIKRITKKKGTIQSNIFQLLRENTNYKIYLTNSSDACAVRFKSVIKSLEIPKERNPTWMYIENYCIIKTLLSRDYIENVSNYRPIEINEPDQKTPSN